MIEEVITYNGMKYAKMHPANELEITQVLRSLLCGEANRESLIQCGKGDAHHFTGDGFAKVVFGLLGEFLAIYGRWAGSQQFPSA